jgi:Uma2 family endonuclease
LQEYVLIDSQRVEVEVWRRNGLGQWTLMEQTTDLAGQFTIQTIGLTISIGQTYARTTELIQS